MKTRTKRIVFLSAAAILFVAFVALAAGCRDGQVLPVTEWFTATADGTPYEQTMKPVQDSASLFGPIGDLVALGIGGFGVLGTAVFGVKSKLKGAKVSKIGPVAQKLIYNLSQIKQNQPEVWAQMQAGISAGMNGDDKTVINHFRPDKDTSLKSLKGVEA